MKRKLFLLTAILLSLSLFLTACKQGEIDEAKAKEYLQELTDGIAEWHGDVGKATAAKKLSEQVKTRGDAFGTNPEDVKNA